MKNINLLLLLISLFILFLIFLYATNFDLLSPVSLSCASFMFVTFIAFSYNGFFKMDISFTTTVFIISSLIVFFIGFLCFSHIKLNVKLFKKRKNQVCGLNISINVSTFILILLIISLYLNYNNTLHIAHLVNPKANIFNMLEYARNAMIYMDIRNSFFVSLLGFISISIGYLYSYVIINNYIIHYNDVKLKILLQIIIVIISLVIASLSTGRTFLIKYIVVCIVMFIYLKKIYLNINKYSIGVLIKNVKMIICALLVFFVSFQLLGITTGKTGKKSTVEMIYEYSGASIIALDISINEYNNNYIDDGRFFGEESFYGFYGFLNAMGIKVPNTILHLPFVTTGENQRTNIYTALRTYLYDFGYFGTYLVQFILGLIIGFLYSLLRKNANNPVYLLLYGIILYGVAMQGIEEIQLRNFMSITNIFTVLFFVLLYNLLIKKKS